MKKENLKRGKGILLSEGSICVRKFIAFLLAFCMLMSNLPYGMIQEVYAEDGMLTESVNLDGVVYKEIEPGKMQLVEWQKNISWQEKIEIPETVEFDGQTYTVVSIGDNAFCNNSTRYCIAEVIFPDTIESIGENAFANCNNITKLELPENLKEIGNGAFYRYSAGGELVIPESVTRIGKEAFCYNMNITSLVIKNPNIVYGSSVFANNTQLTSVKLPEGMFSLGDTYFLYGCTNLTEINLPESLTSIPASAFSGCAGLSEIQIPASVNNIGASAFYGCTGLKEVVVPDGVKEILSQTFCNCNEALSVTFPDSVTSVHNWTFWNNSAGCEKYSKSITVKCTSREVAALVSGIGHQKIELNGEEYKLLKFDTDKFSFTITDSENKYVQLDKWKGAQPSGEVVILETVEWEGNTYTVKTIGTSAFSTCSEITKITLPETITGIGKNAFMSCTGLKSINLPDSLTRIEQWVFCACHELTDVTFPKNLTYIGSFAFEECTGLQTVDIPESCSLIDTSAFWNCTGITNITLHEGLETVGDNAFGGCSGITEIRLPDSVRKLGGYAFMGCAGLEKITLNQGLEEIGIGIFKGCDNLTGTITLPDSVTTIRQDAFVDSSLSGVHVGSGLITLESGAFPDAIRLTTNSLEVWKLLSKNTNRENAPVFVWDGTCDVPAGMHAYVEEDIVITDSVTIEDGAVVTIMPDVSLMVDGMLTNNGTIEGAGAFTVNGTLMNNGTVEAEGVFTVNGVITGIGTLGEGMQMTVRLTEEMVADVDGYIYNAASIEPEPEVSITLGGRKIIFEKGKDFTYSYENNVNPGTADITVTPKAEGKLTGEAVTTHFVIGKAGQTVPASCNLTFTENEDGQTFTAAIERAEGAEYSFDGEIWTNENTKTDCRPNTEYTAYIRMKETDTHSASDAAQTTKKTPKLSQKAPIECKLTFTENSDKQTFTALIERAEGAEYSFDGKTWTDENTKTDCQPNTKYTAYIRMKETDTHSASDAVQKTLKAPALQENTGGGTGDTGDTGNTGGTGNTGETGNAGDTGKPDAESQKLSAPAIAKLKSIAGKKGVSVQVTVKPVAGADRYEIYRTVGKKTKRIKTTVSGKTQIQDDKPVQSAKYYAVAVSKDGRKSAAGKAKSIKLSKGTKIKNVSSTSKGIKITWKKGKSVKKYVLYRSTKKNSGYVRIKTLGKKNLSYVDKKAKKGKKYYYKVVVLTTSKSSLMSAASKRVKRK